MLPHGLIPSNWIYRIGLQGRGKVGKDEENERGWKGRKKRGENGNEGRVLCPIRN